MSTTKLTIPEPGSLYPRLAEALMASGAAYGWLPDEQDDEGEFTLAGEHFHGEVQYCRDLSGSWIRVWHAPEGVTWHQGQGISLEPAPGVWLFYRHVHFPTDDELLADLDLYQPSLKT